MLSYSIASAASSRVKSIDDGFFRFAQRSRGTPCAYRSPPTMINAREDPSPTLDGTNPSSCSSIRTAPSVEEPNAVVAGPCPINMTPRGTMHVPPPICTTLDEAVPAADGLGYAAPPWDSLASPDSNPPIASTPVSIYGGYRISLRYPR